MAGTKGEADQLLHEIQSGFVSVNEQDLPSDTEWLEKPCVYKRGGEFGVMAFSRDYGEQYEFTSREEVVQATHEYNCSQLK